MAPEGKICVGVLEVLMRNLLGALVAASVMAGMGMVVATPAVTSYYYTPGLSATYVTPSAAYYSRPAVGYYSYPARGYYYGR